MSAQYAANEAIDSITRLRIHAHEHRHFPSLATDFFSLEFQKHSKNSHGYISGLGFSSLSDTGTTSRADGTHTNIGHVTENQSYWSRLADLGSVRVAKIVVEYFPGTGRLAGLSLLGEKNEEFVAWKSYGQAKAARPQGLKVEEQVPPSGDGKGEAKDWALVGFWGHVDEIVISRIGGIWRRVIRE